MKAIIVTGTPGTGKTTLAKRLSKRSGYKYIDVSKLIKDNKLEEGYDKKRKCRIVDVEKLNKVLIEIIKNSKKSLIIDSHLSHYLPEKYVDLCIVTKCNLKTLEKRLKKKGYDKNKIRENLDCEIFDVCLNEAKERRHKVMVVDEKTGFENVIKKL
ncbi:AAA family ATPase [Candidatus Woesearchaeota archaeon]|nr:AAA family ATPase [Candidatus Woesearchaeota archaeon]